MQFAYTMIFVENVPETLDFYVKAFKLKKLFLADSLLYGELETGNTKLAFVDEKFAADNGNDFTQNRMGMQKMPGFEIAFTTDDVAANYQHAINSGCIAVHEPKQTPWGQTVANVRDLNGILVEICSPL